jgi:hypothetical protein
VKTREGAEKNVGRRNSDGRRDRRMVGYRQDERIELSGEERASIREWEKKRARRKYYQKRATKWPRNCAVSEQKLR